ncbi:hypothetical protein PTKIN_Ptkin01aG0121400 [Pterospermum kingtungense]
MADLENLLLEAAGRTGTGGRNRHSFPSSRRRHEGLYSDGGSDSRDDNSDHDHGYSSRKPSGSQVSLRKRLDSAERDDDQGSQEEDDIAPVHELDSRDESDVGDDLYKNEDDRRQLGQLTELQRELIMSERADKRGSQGLSPVKRKAFTPNSSSQSESESRPNSEDEGSTGDSGMVNSDDERGLKPVNTALKAGEAGYDPFLRRWTRSRNYYVTKPPGVDASAVANGETSVAIANGNGNDVRAAAEASSYNSCLARSC